jgi:putative salt-induced outer membrane protein YdiY
MRIVSIVFALFALATSVFAQDRVTLANGDVLTGKVKAMAGGKLTIASPLLGDVTVSLAEVKDMSTAETVDLQTTDGDLLVKRRILGMESGRLRLEGASGDLAIANLDKINPPSDPEPVWTGTFKLNGLISTGNTERRSGGAAFDAKRETKADRISLDAAWAYSEERDAVTRDWNLTQRRTGAGLQYDYFLGKRWYALGTARVLGDTFADLSLRFTGGAGVGYTVVDNDTTKFLTEVGLSYVNENYRSNTPSDDYLAARVAYKLTELLSESSKLLHSVEAFPSVDRIDDIYLQARTEYVTSLTSSMLASLAHVLDYDSSPAPGRRQADNRIELSVGWSF